MKTCPYCAESIQDAAIVCKHCRKDLGVTGPVIPPAAVPPKSGWGRLIGVLAVVAVAWLAIYFGADHAKFVEWSGRRDAWVQRCERYATVRFTDPAAKACNDELLNLKADAQRHGWMK